MDGVSELGAIYLLISVICVIRGWIGCSRFKYDSSTDYADYTDEMKPESTLNAIQSNTRNLPSDCDRKLRHL